MRGQKYMRPGGDIEYNWESKTLPTLPPYVRCKELLRRAGRRVIYAWWAWESSAAILSTWATIALLVILAWADKRETQTWNVGNTQLTLNAVIAAVGTVQRASLLLAVTGALNQHMWNWFAQGDGVKASPSRPLKDIATFSEGATNIWHCIVLLWRTKGRYLASLGALIIIQALFFDVFLQQVIYIYQNPTENVLTKGNFNAENILPQVFNFDLYNVGGGNLGDQETFTVLLSLVATGALQTSVQLPGASCPTGDCTWPETPSLALSSRCAALNISKQISANSTCERIITHTLRKEDFKTGVNDMSMGETDWFSSTYLNYSSCGGEHYIEWRNQVGPYTDRRSLVDFVSWGSQYGDPDPGRDRIKANIDDYPFSAYRCQIYFSVKAFSASSSQGRISHNTPKELSSNGGIVPGLDPGLNIGHHATRSDDITPSPFNVGPGALAMIEEALGDVFSRCQSSYSGRSRTIRCESPESPAIHQSFNSLGLWKYSNSLANITLHVQGVADSLTNWMRTNHAWSKPPDAKYAPSVTSQVPTVAVRWAWLSYPLGLQLSGLLFLALTMYRSSQYNIRPWKGARMPLLLARLDDGLQKRALGGLSNRTGLDDRLGDIRVRLDYDGEDGITFRRVDEEI